MAGAGIYDTAPAGCWEDAFPVGNGRHGALVSGDPGDETVIITHHLLVALSPDDLSFLDEPSAGMEAGVPDLAGRLEQVRDLLLAGQSGRALALFTDGSKDRRPRSFHPAFAVRLRDELAPVIVPQEYRRSLNYRTGVASTTWPGRRRTCFVSRARDVVVQHVMAQDGAALDLTVGIEVRLPGAPSGLRVSCQPHERAGGDVLIVTSVQYPAPGRGGYVGVTRVVPGHGECAPALAGGVRITGGSELLLITRVAPFRDALDSGPGRRGALNAVADVPVDQRTLLAEHARLHATAYADVRLDLGGPPAERALPISELLSRQAAHPGRPLPALLERLFDSGRYLLLSASGLLPPRLTGLWQGDWNAAWSGAITGNANLGLQLAGAVTADVPAAVTAVAELVRDRLPDWRVNARRIFGTRGFTVPAHSDGLSGLCTHSAPDYPHQLWTAGADWLLVPLLDAVCATGDTTFLRERVWPALRELAEFYEDFLTRVDEDGHVIVVPSYSPENHPQGWSPAAVNATMDIAAARHSLAAAAAAAQECDATASEAARRWRDLAASLPPYRVNPDGALAEWCWPSAGSGQPPLPDRYDHRHISHLYPVWPLHEITVADTPELAAAALRALRLRGTQDDSAHGYLHKALTAARLRDAELAGQLLAAVTGGGFFFHSLMSSHYPNRSVYNADAACALPGVLIEMLVGSQAPPGPGRPGRVELLPARPDFLPAGRLRGVRTLTGVLVADLRWDAAAADTVLVSRVTRQIEVRFGPEPWRMVTLPAGRPIRIEKGEGDGHGHDR